jgi:hypothetical protein
MSLVFLDVAGGHRRWCGGNRRSATLRRLAPSCCDIATVAGLAPGLVPGGGRAIKAGAGPRAIAMTPGGRIAYVLNWAGGSVTPIDTATPVASIPDGDVEKPRLVPSPG